MFKKIALIPVLSLCCMVSAFEISTDFPGGNIEVLEKSDNGAKVAQQIRDTSEWWFYWNFEVSGAAGKTLEFKFANGDPIGSFGRKLRRRQNLGMARCRMRQTRQGYVLL